MKTLRKKGWAVLLGIAASLVMMFTMMPVAFASANCTGSAPSSYANTQNSKAACTPAALAKACKTAGCTVSKAKAADMIKACKKAGCTTNAGVSRPRSRHAKKRDAL